MQRQRDQQGSERGRSRASNRAGPQGQPPNWQSPEDRWLRAGLIELVSESMRLDQVPGRSGSPTHAPACLEPQALTVTHIFLLWAKGLISLTDLAASGGERGTGHAR